MHDKFYFNGNFVSPSKPMIEALSSAALYGKGVFTTIAVYNGLPFLLEKHWRRLRTDASRLGVDVAAPSFVDLERLLTELISANSVKNGRARVTIFDTSSTEIWQTKAESGTRVLMMTGDVRDQPTELRLTVSPYLINSRSPLAGVKSCNYLEHLLAEKEARGRGFDEAIRLNERGEITSASMANLFWLKDAKLFTPSLETGCLAGTTREFIIENFVCDQVEAGGEELVSADALYICSVGLGIRQVNSLNDRSFKFSHHEILDLVPPADEKNTNVREMTS
jgi:branched-subunit amino acid aminotransferase/4-amino-4-deoxychorismate lyase